MRRTRGATVESERKEKRKKESEKGELTLYEDDTVLHLFHVHEAIELAITLPGLLTEDRVLRPRNVSTDQAPREVNITAGVYVYAYVYKLSSATSTQSRCNWRH